MFLPRSLSRVGAFARHVENWWQWLQRVKFVTLQLALLGAVVLALVFFCSLSLTEREISLFPPELKQGPPTVQGGDFLNMHPTSAEVFNMSLGQARNNPCLDAPSARHNPRLPKIIHVVNARLKALAQDLNKTTLNTWKRLFPEPEFHYRIWTDENIRPFIQANYADFLSSFDKIQKPIVRIDVIRIIALHFFGGLYADLDIEPRINFWDRLPDDRPSIAESPWMGSKLQNSLMSSPPKHAFWTLAMNVVEERISGDFFVTLIAGPGCMDEAHKRLQERFGQNVYALPCRVFNRLGPTWVRKSGIFWDSEGTMRWAEGKGNISEAWRDCGNPEDPRCQWSVHEGACSWCET